MDVQQGELLSFQVDTHEATPFYAFSIGSS